MDNGEMAREEFLGQSSRYVGAIPMSDMTVRIGYNSGLFYWISESKWYL